MKIENEKFGTYAGQDVIKYTLTNDNNVSISVLNFAGIWQSYMVPNTRGGRVNLLLGADNIEAYVNPKNAPLYVGRIIGRFGGRIAKGQFDIDGESYQIPANEGENTLHGGANGFSNHFYDVTTSQDQDKLQVILTATIGPETDQLPGQETMKVTYTLASDNSVTIDFNGQSDQKTLFNPTTHAY